MVDIYLLICYLLGIDFLLNNGLFSRIIYLLKVALNFSYLNDYWLIIGEVIVIVIGIVIVLIVCMYVVLMIRRDCRYMVRGYRFGEGN